MLARRHPLAVLPLAMFLSIAPACGGASRWVRELPAAAGGYLAKAPASYAPPAVGAVSPAETARLRAAFEAAVAPNVRMNLRHEPALDLVAQVLAETYTDEYARPSRALTQWVAWKSGATSLRPRAKLSWARGANRAARLDAYAVESAASLKPSLSGFAYGAARFTQGNITSQAIVTARTSLEVDSFQKTYAPGAPLTLRVRTLDRSSQLVLLMDQEKGDVTQQDFELGPDGSFFLSRRVPERPGRYFLEIRGVPPLALASGEKQPWTRTMLWVPIYVGVPEPSTPDAFISNPLPVPEDSGTWPAWMASFIDAERAKAGRRPTEPHPQLARMAVVRSVAIGSSEDPRPVLDLAESVAAAGISAQSVDQSYGAFDTLSDHMHLKLLSPSARRRLILTDRLLLGIGVTPHEDSKGRLSYFEAEYAVIPR